jgi:hypothetical protein
VSESSTLAPESEQKASGTGCMHPGQLVDGRICGECKADIYESTEYINLLEVRR